MKKQIIPNKSGLNLNKRTISNLNTVEMNQKVGGANHTYDCQITDHCTRGRTCHGNNC